MTETDVADLARRIAFHLDADALCEKCGVMMGRYFSAWRCNGCGEQQTPNVELT